MLSRTYLTRAVLTLTLVTVSFTPTPAQRLEDGEIDFDTKLRKAKLLRKDLFTGTVQPDPKNKDHAEAIDLSAKEFTYPLIWRTQTSRPEPGKINQVIEDFDASLIQLARFKATTAALQPLYTKQVIACAQEVVQKGKPIAAVNGSRLLSRLTARKTDRGYLISEKEWSEEVLPRFSEGNGEHFATACLTLLEEPKCTDGTRYYLLQALADLLALPPQTPPLVKPETVEKVCATAARIVEKKNPFPKATPRTDIEGYKVMRMQAIKLLASARMPATGKERPALVLARVAGNDESLVPAPRLDERVEATIGLGRALAVLAPQVKDFQIDYAIPQICRAIAEFGNQATDNIDSKAVVKLRPWKVLAARLAESLDALKADVKTPYVQDAVKQCLAVVEPITNGAKADANVLSDWLEKNEPQSKSLFGTDPAAVVKPAPVAKDEEPAAPVKEKEKEKEKDKGKEKEKGKEKKKG